MRSFSFPATPFPDRTSRYLCTKEDKGRDNRKTEELSVNPMFTSIIAQFRYICDYNQDGWCGVGTDSH